MEKVNYYIFRDGNSYEEVTVIMEDGGVATTYNPDDYCRTDYYQKRIAKETTRESIWDELGEGKVYNKDWDGDRTPLKIEADDEVIIDMVRWLYMSTKAVEFVRNERGVLTEEAFNELLPLLKLED